MRRLALIACLLSIACEKKVSPPSEKPAAANAEFDKHWLALEAEAEPLFIESTPGGAGLMGEVRRAVDSPHDAGAQLGEKDPWKGELPDAEIVRVIRANLAAVKACYAIAEKANGQELGAGKAIVNLEIDATGTVAGVHVDAPAFATSKLPECVSSRARSWAFPRFTSRAVKRFAYPFVFVGG